jgi:hypothetical protein
VIQALEVTVRCDRCGKRQRFGTEDNGYNPDSQSSGIKSIGINGKVSKYVSLYAQKHGWYFVNPLEQYCYDCVKKGLNSLEGGKE